jgi:hypothetical protein
MINVKTAVRKAVEYVQEFQDYLPQRDVRLEETEFDETGIWLITLSFPSGNILPLGPARDYKEFRIDAETGEVTAMKVRSLAHAK